MPSMPLTLVVYSLQVLCLVGVATAAAALFRLPSPAARFAYWRGVAALCVAVPLLSVFAPAEPAAAASFAIAAAAAFGDASGPRVDAGDLLTATWSSRTLARDRRTCMRCWRLPTPVLLRPRCRRPFSAHVT